MLRDKSVVPWPSYQAENDVMTLGNQTWHRPLCCTSCRPGMAGKRHDMDIPRCCSGGSPKHCVVNSMSMVIRGSRGQVLDTVCCQLMASGLSGLEGRISSVCDETRGAHGIDIEEPGPPWGPLHRRDESHSSIEVVDWGWRRRTRHECWRVAWLKIKAGGESHPLKYS